MYLSLMSVGEYWQRVNFVKTDFREGLVDGLLDSKGVRCPSSVNRKTLKVIRTQIC